MAATDTIGELVDTCSAFCGTGNIPLLVGIPTFGFSHADIDTVCLASDNTLAQPPGYASCAFWPQEELRYNQSLMST